MKLIVIGATGYIGSRIMADDRLTMRKLGTSFKSARSLLPLNLSSPTYFNYSVVDAGDVILFTAAISSPDICANEHDRAFTINVTGSSEVIERLLGRKARVVFFSSDTVYCNQELAVDEAVACQPADDYAVMKCEVEKRFAEHPAFKVVRLPYVFSREDKFTTYLSACARDNKVAEIFHPMSRRVVHLGDLLDLLGLIAAHWDKVPDRLINVCGPELLSCVDMANVYREVVSPDLQIRAVEPSPEFFVARPRVINMSSRVCGRLLGRSPRTLREAMQIDFNGEGQMSWPKRAH